MARGGRRGLPKVRITLDRSESIEYSSSPARDPQHASSSAAVSPVRNEPVAHLQQEPEAPDQVEVPINGPFPEYVEFFNEHDMLIRQQVKFEWTPCKCAHCGMYGHTEEVCKKKNATRKEWRRVQQPQPPDTATSNQVAWVKLVWARANIPIHPFIVWTFMHHRIPTKIRLHKFQPQQDTQCSLCNRAEDDETHLFFEYSDAQRHLDVTPSVLATINLTRIQSKCDDLRNKESRHSGQEVNLICSFQCSHILYFESQKSYHFSEATHTKPHSYTPNQRANQASFLILAYSYEKVYNVYRLLSTYK
ncbi:hypothetical protein Cgig2_023141 [Carnegiea gigantea]|uniref:Reverse transcriptase zinc-binding domain-containing protein n=1 Tax=Carnegiea gigantea TaxID=171969 RepID=A0A9Q1GFD7_9CARY|nr:hypothetical protein Cgig2_023141 [Carnegiea gigantea]